MNFCSPSLSPPFFCFLLFPTETGASSPALSHQLIEPPAPEPTLQGGALEERIILTREDLIEEGYEQTKKAWTEEQDEKLLKLCSNRHLKFDQIAEMMPQRNAKMCYSRYRRLTNQSKECWSKAENQKLKDYVEKYGEGNWRALQQHFPNRNYKQLKDHYENYLRPDIANAEWTVEDDLQLIGLLNLHGKNWKLIESQMPGRSKNQLKNRYFGRLKRMNLKKMQSLQKGDFGNKLSLLPI